MNPLLADALKLLTVLGLAAITMVGGSPIVRMVLRLADSPKYQGDLPLEAASRRIEAAANQLRGGHWIGMLERLACFISVLWGFGEGIAIVLAIKALARYPELRATSPGAAERFIIGTLASVLVAVIAAGFTSWLIGLW